MTPCGDLPSSCNRRLFIFIFAWISLSLALFSYYQRPFSAYIRQDVGNVQLFQIPGSYNFTSSDDGCNGFNNDPFHESILKYFKREATISCKSPTPNFLHVVKNVTNTTTYYVLKVDHQKASRLKRSIEYCTYVSLTRTPGNDFKVVTSAWSKSFTTSINLPDGVEHIGTKCLHRGRIVGIGYFSIARKNSSKEEIYKTRYEEHLVKNNPRETLSVLLMGIDGTSRQNFARQMVKTKKFVLDEMGAIELYKVNKVGLNTFPNVVPMLTGQSEDEVRKLWNDKVFFDKIDHLFLWDEAQRAGYRTSVLLDKTKITSFHFLKQGWAHPKFDFNSRPVVLKSESDPVARKSGPYCVGDTPEITLFYDYWLQITSLFNNSNTTPYFGYAFFAHLTHDFINRASSADELYLDIFRKLAEQKSLNNTLVIFFSDHGSRYGEFRFTYRGMLEDNNPFMFFMFPPWFKSKYPKIMENFQKNQHHLVTSFDIYATLKDILYFKGDDLIANSSNTNHGISLFQELPAKRTCEEANIPLKYCNCRNITSMQVASDLAFKISQVLLRDIISKTASVRKECALLTLNSTISVLSIVTTSSDENFYQATIQTTPGDAVYEATLKSPKKDVNKISVVGVVGRINMYKGQADCVFNARVRPFCYCKNLIS